MNSTEAHPFEPPRLLQIEVALTAAIATEEAVMVSMRVMRVGDGWGTQVLGAGRTVEGAKARRRSCNC